MDDLETWGQRIKPAEIQRKAFNRVKEIYARQIRKQLLTGKDGENISLPPYSNRRVKERRKKGLRTDIKDLYDTSNFNRNVYAEGMADYIEVGSHDQKESEILDNSYLGDATAIMELNDENIDDFLNAYQDALVDEIMA